MTTKQPTAKPLMDEKKRLEILRSYEILDTGPDPFFDNITKLASSICDAPIALVSLVDEERQWFKSNHGLTVCETSRDVSFCSETIKEYQIMIVPNATEDERFKANSLVTGDPGIRFYAGAPLTTKSGYNLGSVCVIDRRQRKLTEEQMSSLKLLAEQTVAHLDYMKVSRELAECVEQVNLLKSIIPICSHCKKMRDDQGFWNSLEKSLAEHKGLVWSHGICPECEEEHYGHL